MRDSTTTTYLSLFAIVVGVALTLFVFTTNKVSNEQHHSDQKPGLFGHCATCENHSKEVAYWRNLVVTGV